MDISGKKVLITGAGGALGSALSAEFLKRGATKIYAADLRREPLEYLQKQLGHRICPVVLDITNQQQVRMCADLIRDIQILVNNAGIEMPNAVCGIGGSIPFDKEMAVNYYGMLYMVQAFWPVLSFYQPSAIINILSIAALDHIPRITGYCASKSAAHMLTEGLRKESEGTKIRVIGVYPGYFQSEMVKHIDVPKANPSDVAHNICNSFELGHHIIHP